MSFWDRFLEELRQLGEFVVEWAILIVTALLVLLIGRWILRIVRRWTEKLLNIGPMDTMWDRSGVNRALQPSGQSAAALTATILYAWLLVGLWLICVPDSAAGDPREPLGEVARLHPGADTRGNYRDRFGGCCELGCGPRPTVLGCTERNRGSPGPFRSRSSCSASCLR